MEFVGIENGFGELPNSLSRPIQSNVGGSLTSVKRKLTRLMEDELASTRFQISSGDIIMKARR